MDRYSTSRSKDLSQRPTVVKDIHKRIAQLESFTTKHQRFPDQTVYEELSLGLAGKRIDAPRNRTVIQEYKPKPPPEPLQDIRRRPMPKIGAPRKAPKEPVELHQMYGQLHHPTPVLPNIVKKNSSTGSKKVSTVNLPQYSLNADKPKKKEWWHVPDQNSEVPFNTRQAKKIGVDKLSVDKNEHRVKKPLTLEPLTEATEAKVWGRLEKKYNLPAPDGLTTLRQEKSSNTKHRFFDDVKDAQSSPLPRIMANNLKKIRDDHFRQMLGLKTKKESRDDDESVNIDRDILLAPHPPTEPKPTKAKRRRRKQPKGD